jgi:spore maturation protein SpmB
MFTASGALYAFTSVIGPYTALIGLPAEALPMAFLRPLSGSGASGVMMATMANPATGPDTYTGYLVSTIQGSSETTFYVLAVYYGAISVKKMRHTLFPALGAEVFGVIGSIIAVQAYWRFVVLAP